MSYSPASHALTVSRNVLPNHGKPKVDGTSKKRKPSLLKPLTSQIALPTKHNSSTLPPDGSDSSDLSELDEAPLLKAPEDREAPEKMVKKRKKEATAEPPAKKAGKGGKDQAARAKGNGGTNGADKAKTSRAKQVKLSKPAESKGKGATKDEAKSIKPKKVEVPVEPPVFEKVDTRLSLDEADQRMAVSESGCNG
jgi:hypothetical protein